MLDKNKAENSQCISFIDGRQGQCLLIETSQSQAKLSLFGGQLLSFVSKGDGRERLWVSEKAIFDGKTPIRGGIPICWPWFSAHPIVKNSPNHGFVRTQKWELIDVTERFVGNKRKSVPSFSQELSLADHITLKLSPTMLGEFGYSQELSLTLNIELGASLCVSLNTHNNSQETIELSQALHTYFNIPDVNDIKITGISDVYFDKTTNSHNNNSPSPYLIKQEVDRVHSIAHNNYTQQQSIDLVSIASTNSIQKVSQKGHDSIVVWNPWQSLSVSMQDMPDNGYQSMLCIEAANIRGLILAPGKTHTLKQTIY